MVSEPILVRISRLTELNIPKPNIANNRVIANSKIRSKEHI
jgi:hypothetical protein